MKKKIIASLAISTVLASAAFAYGGNNCNMMNNQGPSCNMQGKMMKNSHNMFFMKMLHQLNLTTKQKADIRTIVQEAYKQKQNPYKAFTKDGFNEKEFIDSAMNKKENMIKLKAKIISDIYVVLTKKQKEQLRVLMDLQVEKAGKGMHCNMNSRRGTK